MYAIFRTELTKKGSSIVTNVEEADAILYIFAWTMMSPTQSPPAELLQNEYSKLSKYEYECQLKSRELKILWATKFECWTEDEEEKSDHAAARKIAKQLLKALPQYAKKQRK